MPDGTDAFWAWVERTYTPAEVKTLRDMGRNIAKSPQWEYYVTYRQSTPRYSASQFGITDEDFTTLMTLGLPGERLEAKLKQWISTGRIDVGQASEIWDEVVARRGFSSSAAYREEEERRKQVERQRPLEEEERLKLKEEENIRKLWAAGLATRRPQQVAWPQYGTAEENLPDIPGAETETWDRWFSSRFPSVIQEFEKTRSRGRTVYPGRTAEETSQALTEGWKAHWDSEQKRLVEKYWKQGPYARGERPAAFAPRIQTVAF